MRTPDPGLTPEQAADAERIYQALRHASADEHWGIAQLLASKPDGEVFGQAEYEVRDLVHKTGAEAIQAALDGRKRGGTAGRA
jgi:hypothetical protein